MAWCKPGIDSGWLDPCTLKNEVLPHFIAVRIVGNSPDPCPQRWGLIPGARDRVPVPDHALRLPERRDGDLKITTTTLAEREAELRAHYGADLNARRRDAVRVICGEIEAVRAVTVGARHPTYLSAAARIHGLCAYWAIPLDQPRALLEAGVPRNTDPGGSAPPRARLHSGRLGLARAEASMPVNFTPTEEWQDVPEDAVLPAGCQVEMNQSTGRKRARKAPNGPTGTYDFKAAYEKAELSEFDLAVGRLAQMPRHEYDRVRKAEAKKLGVRVATLDAAVFAFSRSLRKSRPSGRPPNFNEADQGFNLGQHLGQAQAEQAEVLSASDSVLDQVADTVKRLGAAGVRREAKILYLALTTPAAAEAARRTRARAGQRRVGGRQELPGRHRRAG